MNYSFKNREEFRNWLNIHRLQKEGIWLIFGKKNGPSTLSPEEALEEALCFGWIDGQIKSIDAFTYIKYFKRRLEKSNWSQRNRDLVEKLIQEGKMTYTGLQAIENAKRGGTWIIQYEKIENMEVEAFLDMLEDYPIAYENFSKMSASVQRTYTGFYLSAKREDTRIKRFQDLVNRLEKNLKPMEQDKGNK